MVSILQSLYCKKVCFAHKSVPYDTKVAHFGVTEHTSYFTVIWYLHLL